MNLTASHISVRAGGKPLVRDVSFSVHDGDWLMIVGPNGAGKSTLVRAITGALRAEGGATLDGESLAAMRPARRAQYLGVLSQETRLSGNYTVEEIVALGRYARRRGVLSRVDEDAEAAIARALSFTGLTERRRQSVATLSGGERQRVYLAQVFCQEPQILVLDEPGNHLDLQVLRGLMDLIDAWRRAPGRAVISVLHDLSLARLYGTHALLMESGAGLFGPAHEVLSAENLSRVWRMDVGAWMKALYAPWADAQ